MAVFKGSTKVFIDSTPAIAVWLAR